jgi:uncharacterized DUF497 family protein
MYRLRVGRRQCRQELGSSPRRFLEAEEVFFNEPLVIRADPAHSVGERRFLALGRTDSGRLLFLSFTVRRTLIRIISARGMTRREAHTYEHTKA